MNCSITIENFHAICRICLVPKNDMIAFSSPLIAYMLESCTSTQEIPNKKLPQQICMDCYKQLQNAFHFKQQYLISIQILTEIIFQSENCDKDEKNRDVQEVQKKQDDIDNDEDSSRKIANENIVNELNIKREIQNENVTNVFNVEIKPDPSSNSDNDYDENNDYDTKENYTIPSNEDIFKQIEKTRFNNKCDMSRFFRTCDKCGKTFKPEYFRRHMKRHSDNRPYECNICHKKFKHSYYINQHKKIRHSLVNTAKGLCFICGKFFKSSLKTHEITHTEISETDQYKCDKCGKVYGRESSLREHIRLRHSPTSTETYACKICNKVMTFKASLERHMKHVHSDLRQYVCLDCNKGFKTKTQLNIHIKAVHLNERPYSCTICGKNFNTQPILTNHMRTHTGERPFSCHICKKSFSFRAALMTHRKQHSK